MLDGSMVLPALEFLQGAGEAAREQMGPLLVGLYVFVLATIAGREVIGRVPPTLHTPLMSGANAISGIAIVGALAVTAGAETTVVRILGIVGVAMAMINVVGGFMVTDRMLEMFRKK
jgi:NAD(P) transhydrogenase subunit alpha